MSSKSVELADAIVASLNDEDNEFVLTFDAKRRAAPFTINEIEELKTLQVSVFTGSVKAERTIRAGFAKTYRPVVALQQKLGGETDEVNLAIADKITELSEQIVEHLGELDLAELSFAAFDEEQDREQYNAEALRDLGVYAVAIGLEYTDG